MKEILRIQIAEALDWDTGKRTLRETLVDLAFNFSGDLRKQERKCEDAGGDFWSYYWLKVSVDGDDFVVCLEKGNV